MKQHNNKKWFILITFVMAFCLCGFSDVPKSFWGYAEINTAYDLGIIQGYDDSLGYKGRFGPKDSTTKEQLAVMIYRVLKANNQLETQDDLSEKYLEELKSSKIATWAYKEVSYGFEYGLWAPEEFQEKSAFGGSAKIGRLMISRWLSKAAALPISPIRVIEYTDVSDCVDYYNYLDALYRYGIMIGDSGKFSPKSNTTRAEAATVCTRLIKREIPVGSSLSADMLCMYGSFSNFDSNSNSFIFNSGNEIKTIQIDSNAVIILNGKVSSFNDLARLEGSTMTISTVACDQQVIVAHNTVSSFAGKEFLVALYEKRDAYTLVYLANDEYVIPFCITDNTTIFGGTLKAGSKVNIMSDGCELIEVKVL